MEVKCKKAKSLPEFIDSIRLRVDVFIKEQGFEPGWEPDEDEKNAVHFIAIENGIVVSTARYREIANSEFKIERMATRKEQRGKGAAGKLLLFMLKEIKTHKPKKIWLRAQERVQTFYEKHNFKTISSPFEIYGKMHVDMEYEG